jgi:hypothetical protein
MRLKLKLFLVALAFIATLKYGSWLFNSAGWFLVLFAFAFIVGLILETEGVVLLGQDDDTYTYWRRKDKRFY